MFNESKEKWIGVTQAASHLSVSRETIYRWVREKDLPCRKVGNLLRFKISGLDNWASTRQLRHHVQEKKLNLLLVEDDAMDVKNIKRLLRGKNFQITVAENGRKALKLLEKKVPDIIFLDLNLPLLDGVSVLKEIKNQSKFNNVPVICITGFDKYLKKALPLSPLMVLSKPLTEKKINKAFKIAFQKMVVA